MEILKIKNEHESELLKISGVTGVGILGNTSTAIIIYVEKLTPQLASILPKNIEGIPTKIIKTGKIIPLGLSFMPAPAAATYQARTSRIRPAPGGVSVGHPCYDKTTKTLTEDGFKHFWELTYEDKIATLNHKTGELEYQPPTHIFEFDYDGEMIHFQSSLIDLMVTPNHKIYYRWSRKDSFKLEEAKQALRHYYKEIEFKRNAKWNCAEVEVFSLPLDEKSSSYYKLKDWNGTLKSFSEQHEVSYRTARRWKKEETKPLVLYSKQKFSIDNWIKLLGWYLTEGCPNGNTTVISEKSGEYHEEIKNLLDDMELNYCITNAGDIRISHKLLTDYFRMFGHANEKYIPKEIKALSSEKLSLLLDTLLKGDGRFEEGYYRYFKTTSKQLAEDTLEIGLKCGYGVTLTTDVAKAHNLGKRMIKGSKAYRVGFSYSKLTPTFSKQPKTVRYKGKIYSVEVPNHIIFVERNGRTCWSGNSITAGTLTCRAVDSMGKVYGLSCNHVIALDWGTEHVGVKGDSTLQPGPYDGGVDPTDKIGELDHWIPVSDVEDNIVDIGAFSTGEVISTIEELGIPDAVIDPYVGQNVVKSGRTSGVTYGSIIDTNATIVVSGWGDVTFKDQITMGKMLDPGDSGSCILESDTLKIVGVGHAGSPDMSVACKAKNVESLLNVQMISPAVALPLPTGSSLFVTGAFASAFLVGQNLLKPRGVEEGIVI